MAAIAARADLQQSNVSCTWQQHDFMVGKRAYGAIDAKVLSSSMSDKQSFLAVAGPTTQVRIVCNPPKKVVSVLFTNPLFRHVISE